MVHPWMGSDRINISGNSSFAQERSERSRCTRKARGINAVHYRDALASLAWISYSLQERLLITEYTKESSGCTEYTKELGLISSPGCKIPTREEVTSEITFTKSARLLNLVTPNCSNGALITYWEAREGRSSATVTGR